MLHPLAEPRSEPVGHQGQIAHGVVSALVQDQNGDLLLIDPASGSAEAVAETPRGAGSVYSIAEASPGEIWVGRAGGIELRGLDRRLLCQIRHHALNPAGLAQARDGSIWPGCDAGLYRLDVKCQHVLSR